MGCSEGRSAERWIDFNFFGHQISVHLDESLALSVSENQVDGDAVPVRHFGAILSWSVWEQLAASVADKEWPFLIAPKVRFEGQAGEQGTFFLQDPSGNALEFKSFKDLSQVFQIDLPTGD